MTCCQHTPASIHADSPEKIATALIALDAPFTLDAPPELRDELHILAERLATAARPPENTEFP